MTKKICIIGGGPTGISLGKEFNEANINYDLYEAESDFGGVWNSDSNAGRTYKSLHLISPKSITQLVDYPMPEDYPHYPNHKLVLDYWRNVAKKFNIYKNTTFNTAVVKVVPEKTGWNVELSSGEKHYYDLTFVCNGLQREPRYPNPMPKGNFTGEAIHSSEYKDPSQVKDKRVLVIGAGNSGCDIAVDCVHHSAQVFHSTRRGYYYQPKFIAGQPTADWMLSIGSKFNKKEETLSYIQQVFKLAGFDGTSYGLPEPDYPLDAAHPILNSHILYHIGHGDIYPKGDVESFKGKQVNFIDGTSITVDVVIYATGYSRKFVFLEPELLEWKNEIPNLFLHMVPKNFDNLFFLGFINTATGFGSAVKTFSNFAKEYINAFYNKTKGLDEFNKRKKVDIPNLGNDYYINSYRHQWEVDLWKYLTTVNKYRDILSKR